MIYKELGRTGIKVPLLIFGTSCPGNLYQALPEPTKLDIIKEIFQHVKQPVALDSAGKYGAGLALEVMGRNLKELGIRREEVVLSNKLGWLRVPLRTPEPTFEPGVWADLSYDAKQDISYEGILRCWDQGCQLLGENYRPQLVSVHDPKAIFQWREKFFTLCQAYKVAPAEACVQFGMSPPGVNSIALNTSKPDHDRKM